MHLDALRMAMRMQALPLEFELIRDTLLNAPIRRVPCEVPATAALIYGPRGAEGFRIPGPVVVADTSSAILLLDAESPGRGPCGTVEFLEVRRYSLDGLQVLTRPELEPLVQQLGNALVVTWGAMQRLRYEAPSESRGYSAQCTIIAQYRIDPELGVLLRAQRDIHVINMLVSHQPIDGWCPLTLPEPAFSEFELRGILQNVVHAIHQLALTER